MKNPMKTPKYPSANEWTNIVYQKDQMLFNHMKELSTDWCYNMDKLGKCYPKWKKLITKGHTLYDSIYMKYPA